MTVERHPIDHDFGEETLQFIIGVLTPEFRDEVWRIGFSEPRLFSIGELTQTEVRVPVHGIGTAPDREGEQSENRHYESAAQDGVV